MSPERQVKALVNIFGSTLFISIADVNPARKNVMIVQNTIGFAVVKSLKCFSYRIRNHSIWEFDHQGHHRHPVWKFCIILPYPFSTISVNQMLTSWINPNRFL